VAAWSYNVTLDRTDIKILGLLQEQGGLSNLELADRVGLSPTPCARRVKRLESEGIIKSRVTLLDQSRLGLTLTAHIGVTMDRHTPERFEAFEAAISAYPEVIECCVVTGQSADYLIKVVVVDMVHYEQFLLGRLTRIAGVTGVHSSFELRKVVSRTALPLSQSAGTAKSSSP
jgi:Lrp/AsnC family leucine-responsive transcriptional regulator